MRCRAAAVRTPGRKKDIWISPPGGTVTFITEAEGCCAGETGENCRVKFTISDTGSSRSRRTRSTRT